MGYLISPYGDDFPGPSGGPVEDDESCCSSMHLTKYVNGEGTYLYHKCSNCGRTIRVGETRATSSCLETSDRLKEESEQLKAELAKITEPSRQPATKHTTHHHACACREAQFAQWKERAEQAESELASERKAHESTKADLDRIDDILSRRPALSDCRTRDDKILLAIETASRSNKWRIRYEDESKAYESIKRELAAITNARNQFCKNINDIARIIGMSGKDHFAPEAIIRSIEEMKQELSALKDRLEKAPVTETTYWEIYEFHQSPYTRIANMSGNPLKLQPGQSKRVKLVEVEMCKAN